MNHSPNVDHEAILRARATLLGSGTVGLHEEIRAYRVLAHVGPLTYLPKLSRALLEFGEKEFTHQPEIRLNLTAEALDAARALDASDPQRSELLSNALDAYRRQLEVLGRPVDSLAIGEEGERPQP
ncbi:hypothetical protein ABZ721_26260 [Streptomyces sp. NPDC006733]|uniref:hypothetical protein n=1 Tax=Streptomyces sp. NPDC006733 TaxID=3155460 RepID=UPI0033FEA626